MFPLRSTAWLGMVMKLPGRTPASAGMNSPPELASKTVTLTGTVIRDLCWNSLPYAGCSAGQIFTPGAAVTYVNDEGKEDYADLTFCDSEVRWIMEALWHAPIWD